VLAVPDDLDLLELTPVPPVTAAAAHRRRGLRIGGALVAAALVGGLAGAVAVADDPDRAAIDDSPTPSVPAPAPVAPDGPSPAPGGLPQPQRGPVVEGFPLQASGGAGPFDFGAPRAAVLAAATGQIGPPVHELIPTSGPACTDDDRIPADWTTFTATMWGDLTLSFAGPTPEDQRLVSWTVVARPDAGRRFRLDGGPALDDPLPTWGRAYRGKVEMGRLSGDRGQVDATVHLPGGDVSIVGHAQASGRAVVVHAGTTCRRPG
jgi:hypothetical protein